MEQAGSSPLLLRPLTAVPPTATPLARHADAAVVKEAGEGCHRFKVIDRLGQRCLRPRLARPPRRHSARLRISGGSLAAHDKPFDPTELMVRTHRCGVRPARRTAPSDDAAISRRGPGCGIDRNRSRHAPPQDYRSAGRKSRGMGRKRGSAKLRQVVADWLLARSKSKKRERKKIA